HPEAGADQYRAVNGLCIFNLAGEAVAQDVDPDMRPRWREVQLVQQLFKFRRGCVEVAIKLHAVVAHLRDTAQSPEEIFGSFFFNAVQLQTNLSHDASPR